LHLHTLHLRKYPRGNLKSNEVLCTFWLAHSGLGYRLMYLRFWVYRIEPAAHETYLLS
jgi:hypothetical protein